MALDVDPTSLGLEFGTGAVIGGVIGFAAKKIAKLIAVIVGLELALFKFLESRGVLQVNWDKVGATFLQASDAASGSTPPSWLSSLLSTLSISAGFTGGFLLGFRKG
jgi:uncharacterized membrane protein (Fun14 family)